MKTLNNTKKRCLLIISAIIFSLGSFFAYANTTIKGKITDKAGNAIPYATATIINPKTMEIVKGDMTDGCGNFIIENVQPGKYILSLRMVGFDTDQTKVLEIKESYEIVNLHKLTMNESNILLAEIDSFPKNVNLKKDS